MIKWNGDILIKKVHKAIRLGMDETMTAALFEAKNNHPGWSNVTGTAEGSVRIKDFSKQLAGSIFRGVWGSVDVNYVIWLELKHGSFLRNSADKHHKNLGARIRRRLKGIAI